MASFSVLENLPLLSKVLRPILIEFLLHVEHAEMAGALAVLEGLKASRPLSNQPLFVESDCSPVIQAINSNEMDRSSVCGVIAMIKSSLTFDLGISCRKVDRKANEAAHGIARWCSSVSSGE